MLCRWEGRSRGEAQLDTRGVARMAAAIFSRFRPAGVSLSSSSRTTMTMAVSQVRSTGGTVVALDGSIHGCLFSSQGTEY